LSNAYVYSAQDNLETMLDADNYNNYQRDFINKAINSVPGRKKTVLDFGAGIGTYADMVRTKKQPIDCVEPTAAQAKILKTKGYKVYKDIKDIKSKYDVIYALNVLEHIEDDQSILAALGGVVSDKGKIVIFVPAFRLIWTGLDDKAEHYRRYRINDMKRLAKATGLKIESVKYCDPVGFFGALVYKLIGGSGTLTPRSVFIFDRFFFPVSKFVEPIFRKILGKNVLVIFVKAP
jgi:SAM-dependent methyltransferase